LSICLLNGYRMRARSVQNFPFDCKHDFHFKKEVDRPNGK
jgi:hypothetical protein